jgi:hypothetical protein
MRLPGQSRKVGAEYRVACGASWFASLIAVCPLLDSALIICCSEVVLLGSLLGILANLLLNMDVIVSKVCAALRFCNAYDGG